MSKTVYDIKKQVVEEALYVILATKQSIRFHMYQEMESMYICGSKKALASEVKYLELRERESVCMRSEEAIKQFLEVLNLRTIQKIEKTKENKDEISNNQRWT